MERVFDKGRLRLKRKCSLEERWRGRERDREGKRVRECVRENGKKV